MKFPKLSISDLVSLGGAVAGIVTNVQRALGHEPGSVRKAAAMDAASDTVALIEQVSKQDILNDAAVQALLSELIEIAVQQRKLYERTRAIEAQIHQLRATSAPGPDGTPA